MSGRVLVAGVGNIFLSDDGFGSCCEPASTGYGMELSEPVAATVDEAARIVTDLAVAAAGQPAVTQDGDE